MNRISRLARLRSFVPAPGLLVAFSFLLSGSGPARGAGPEIFSLDPAEGTAGDTIHVKGKGFKKPSKFSS